jgi:hypothetical protein
MEALHAQNIRSETGDNRPVHLFVDSTSAMNLLAKRGPGRLRHLQAKELWLQELTGSGRVVVKYLSTKLNVSDMFTKPLARVRFEELVTKMGMRLPDGGPIASDMMLGAVLDDEMDWQNMDYVFTLLLIVGSAHIVHRGYRAQREIRRRIALMFTGTRVKDAHVDPAFGTRTVPGPVMRRLSQSKRDHRR